MLQEHLSYCCWVAKLCPTLCNPMDCSLPGSSIHGILQARTLGWVAISSSRGSSRPTDWNQVPCFFCIGRQIFFFFLTPEAPAIQVLFGEKMRISAWGTAPRIVLRNRSKEAGRKSVYLSFWWRGSLCSETHSHTHIYIFFAEGFC